MTSGERDELNAPVKEQRIGAEHECAGALLQKTCKNGLDLAAITGMKHLDLLSDRRCRCPHLDRGCIGQRIVRIEQQADEFGAGQQLTDQPEPLLPQSTAEVVHAGSRCRRDG